MADSPDNVTLLKLRGDASQLKSESSSARQVVLADMRAMEQAAIAADTSAKTRKFDGWRIGESAGPTMAAANRNAASEEFSKLTDARRAAAMSDLANYEKEAQATSVAAGGHKKLNDEVDRGQTGREALSMILGRINPELGAMANVAMRGQEAVGLLLNPMTISATAAAAAVTLLMAEIQGMIEESRRGLEVAREAEKQMRELKKARRGDDEDIRTTFGKAGIFDGDEVKKGKAIEEKLAARGISRDKIREVLPFATEGDLTDEQITDLIGFQELGPGGLDAKDARSRKESMRKVSSFFKKNPNRQAEYRGFYGRRQADTKQDVSQLEAGTIAKQLMERREAGSDEEAKKQEEDLINLMKYGKVETNPEHFFWTQRGSDEYKMDLNSRQVQAAGRAARLGLADPKTANRLAAGTYGDALGIKGTWTGFTPAPNTDSGTGAGSGRTHSLLERIAQAVETQRPPTVNVNVAGQGRAPAPVQSSGLRRSGM